MKPEEIPDGLCDRAKAFLEGTYRWTAIHCIRFNLTVDKTNWQKICQPCIGEAEQTLRDKADSLTERDKDGNRIIPE